MTSERFAWSWFCETCRARGTLMMPRRIGGYEGATQVLEAHRAASPQCRGGVDTVRVGEQVKEPPRNRKGMRGAFASGRKNN